jgi:hypothetical protein
MKWNPVDTAPRGVNLLLWWRPIANPRYPHPPENASTLSNNKYAEACVIGTLTEDEEGNEVWWNGQAQMYQDIWHITHWMPLPKTPEEAVPADTE